MYKNIEKIDELVTEFNKLQEIECCEFAPNIDGFIDFLAEKIMRLEGEVRMRVRRRMLDGWGELKAQKEAKKLKSSINQQPINKKNDSKTNTRI